MNTPFFADSHAHLTDPRVYPECPALLERAQKAGVKLIINICVDKPALEKGLQLQRQYPWIYNAAAISPHDVDNLGESQFPFIATMAHQHKLIAIGETGLDYHYFHSSKENQQDFFLRHLSLAQECGLPLIIHCRDAFQDLFALLDSHPPLPPILLHCFTGTRQEAETAIQLGFFISISGIVTFPNSRELQATVAAIPLSKILLETDTPYLAPQNHRGHPNEPSFLPETAEKIAALRHIPLSALAEATAQNTRGFFGLA